MSTYKDSSRLWVEAIFRMAGFLPAAYIQQRLIFPQNEKHESREGLGHYFCTKWLKADLERAMQQQDTIFEEEKQNLYVDPIREIDAWMEVFWRLEPFKDGIKTPHSLCIYNLGVRGILLKSRKAKFLEEALKWNRDGVLGIMSRPKVFTFIYSYATTVRLYEDLSRMANGGGVGLRFSYLSRGPLQARLRNLKGIGESAHLHEVLLAKMDEAVERWKNRSP